MKGNGLSFMDPIVETARSSTRTGTRLDTRLATRMGLVSRASPLREATMTPTNVTVTFQQREYSRCLKTPSPPLPKVPHTDIPVTILPVSKGVITTNDLECHFIHFSYCSYILDTSV